MTSALSVIILVPGFVALLLFLVFTYLYRQSRQPYFRAWQLGWAAYCAHYALIAAALLGHESFLTFFLSRELLLAMALCIFVSTRLVKEEFHLLWVDGVLALVGTAISAWDVLVHVGSGLGVHAGVAKHIELEVAIAGLLVYCAFRFIGYGRELHFISYRLLGFALCFWAVLLGTQQFHDLVEAVTGRAGILLGPLPQMLLGLAMVMVLYENDRLAVQENALAFSTLDVDSTRLLTAGDVAPSLERILDRLVGLVRTEHAGLFVGSQWRTTLPSVYRGFSHEFAGALQAEGIVEHLSEIAYRQGGMAGLSPRAIQTEPWVVGSPSRFERVRSLLRQEKLSNLTVLSLRTRDRDLGVVVFSRAAGQEFGQSFLRTLVGLAMQLATTLENYVLMHDAGRRTKEYELLTQIGQAISSRLNTDDILHSIHEELGQLFDTDAFYIAFVEGDDIRFEFQVMDGRLQPKYTRKATNAITEHVIRTAQPTLIRNDLQKVCERLGVVPQRRWPKCYCGVPIQIGRRAAGVMAALHYEHEFVYDERDLEVMQTAAGQVAVAIENARLFAREQRRAHDLEFLNAISKMAISSQDPELMLVEIVAEIQKRFNIDHIGIGMLDYATKEIVIKAEAGTTGQALGKRLPLAYGTIGRVARSGETAVVQNLAGGQLASFLTDARSIVCIPLSYGQTLLGVLNVESRRENAFAAEELLILNTLADLLATALHNAFVFQKMQQQSITDGLTGIKTRRFFLEALQSEWKRASRSGRPFSVAMIDMDHFKEVNDALGHLEGDLVLARVGRLLELKSRHSNVVARYGGDEFVILMPETTLEKAQVLAERLRLWLATDPMLNQRHITASIGLATFPLHGSTGEELLRVADAGMYVAKQQGGNRLSTAKEYIAPESAVLQRQLLASYLEEFLRREDTGPDSADELISALKKVSGTLRENPAPLMESISVLAHAAETRELYMAGHGEYVARYAEALARELGMTQEEISQLVYAARVHDVGKILIPEKHLCKAGPLTSDEYDLLKMHSRLGAEIVETIPGSENLRALIMHHHERVDGTGYPDGLRGEQIPLGSRILCVADSYVNMTTEHPSGPAKTAEEAISEMEARSGTQFDGMLVRLFIRLLETQKLVVRTE